MLNLMIGVCKDDIGFSQRAFLAFFVFFSPFWTEFSFGMCVNFFHLKIYLNGRVILGIFSKRANKSRIFAWLLYLFSWNVLKLKKKSFDMGSGGHWVEMQNQNMYFWKYIWLKIWLIFGLIPKKSEMSQFSVRAQCHLWGSGKISSIESERVREWDKDRFGPCFSSLLLTSRSIDQTNRSYNNPQE